MPNMNPKKCPMPEQAPDVRNKNFEEVTLGYTAEMAVEEAQRCLNCKNKPYAMCCPVQVKIRSLSLWLPRSKFLGSCRSRTSTARVWSCLPPGEPVQVPLRTRHQGEAVAIGRLERFVADYARENSTEKAVKPESTASRLPSLVQARPV